MEKTMKDDKKPADRQRLLTAKEVAEYTGFSIRTIYKYSRDEANPQLVSTPGPGGHLRFLQEDVDAWLLKFPRRSKRTSANRK
jgi:predicted DNA-binding transcriptional regulator AlpA